MDSPIYKDEDHQLIDDYLAGLLSEAAQQEVKERLQKDSSFAAHYQLHRDLEGILEATEKQSLKQNWTMLMAEAEAEMELEVPKSPLEVVAPSTSKNRKVRSFHWLRVAALILVFLIPALLYWTGVFDRTSTNSPEQLAMVYFEAPENLAVIKRGDTTTIAIFQQQAQTFYEQKNYQNTLTVLEQMAEKQALVNKSQVYFSMGICHFLLKENEQAVQQFLNVRATDGIKSKANWYLALTYLQQGDTTKAIAVLEKVVVQDGSSKRKKKARELLKKLN